MKSSLYLFIYQYILIRRGVEYASGSPLVATHPINVHWTFLRTCHAITPSPVMIITC